MQENNKRIKLQKAIAIALLCLFFAVFVGSIFCATILPFADVSGVASADSIIPKNLPTLGDLDSGASVYGLVVDTANFDRFVESSFSSLKKTDIHISFSRPSLTSYLTFSIYDVSDNSYFLFFDFGGYGGTTSFEDGFSYPLGSCIYANDGGASSGFGYLLFDDSFVYTVPTDSNALTLCEGVFAITSPLNELWSSSSFTNRFVTPYNYACQDVYFDLSVTPTIPSVGVYPMPSGSLYLFDYFQYKRSFNSITTVGWTFFPSGSNTWSAVLSIGSATRGVRLFTCTLSGSSITTSTMSNPKWLVSGNMSDTDNQVYHYTLTNQDKYFAMLNDEANSVVIGEHFSNSMWGRWLALADIFNLPMLDNNLTYNAGFDSGYSSGYYQGDIDGQQTGYDKGFTDGKVNGYNLGYDEGKVSSSYSFSSLLGAVFDAPIEAFKGLFNFEILGTNMQGFVLALLTLSVIIVVIKIALGGK